MNNYHKCERVGYTSQVRRSIKNLYFLNKMLSPCGISKGGGVPLSVFLIKNLATGYNLHETKENKSKRKEFTGNNFIIS